MAKSIDINGFWTIKDNPLTKEGVFPYLGKQIDPLGRKYDLVQDAIYWVYRPFSEIQNAETLASFENKPFIDEHEMLGEGCTSTDCKNIAGVINNIRAKNGMMIGDFTIYSDQIKKEILSGKKQLSLGYRSSFKKEHGVFDGHAYDFVQVGMVGNHVALVDRGRCGSDVRIFDKQLVIDSLEIPQMEINREELKSIIDGMDEETLAKAKASIEDIVGKPEAKVVPAQGIGQPVKDEDVGAGKKPEGNTTDEKPADDADCKKPTEDDKDVKSASEEKPCEDEKPDEKKGDEKPCEKPCEDEKPCGDKCEDKKEEKPVETKDEAVPTMDEAAIRKDAAVQYQKAVRLHDALVPHIGEFTMDEMFTEQDVAVYGCKKLVEKNLIEDSALNAGSEIATLTGFLAGCKDNGTKVVTVDHGVEPKSAFDFRAAYLAK